MDIGDIPESMKKVLEFYEENLRGKDVTAESTTVKFWDMVVLTARDEAQRAAYERQVSDKLEWGQLPRGIPYHVFADPPGPKVGCGGCTFGVLHSLHQQYGESLYQKRILLLNAGGYSQRLPTTSVLGKLFMALPIGEHHMFQLLDYKLACHVPLLDCMRPGVFHASSDTVEVFDLGGLPASNYSFDHEGFTAVAHPNSLEIGRNHGVFVFPHNETEGNIEPKFVEVHPCLEVLQKPSEELMRQKSAVRKNPVTGEEFVYTDSFYFYDHSITKKFIEFYKKEAPFDCEIDSYGDFFQPLGPNATEEYIYNTSKVVNVTESLIPTRKKIYNMLKGTPLHVVALNASKFYHLGTSKEYLYHMCKNEDFAKELGAARERFSAFPCEDSEGMPRKPLLESHHEGVHLHSIIPHSSEVAPSSVIEYSHFAIPVNVAANCIVSNCTVSDDHRVAPVPENPSSNADGATGDGENSSSDMLQIPEGVYLHTVPVQNPDGYCTVIFSINDNIKQRVSSKSTTTQEERITQLNNLIYLSKPLGVYQKALGFNSLEDVLGITEDLTLWDTKLFPLCSTMSESFLAALRIAKAVEKEEQDSLEDLKRQPRFSMADIMEKKNVDVMLHFRQDLYTCIVALKAHQPPQ